ncbi:MAG: SpoIIE family protein phosphatase [Acidobacteriota bacterium]|jgi:sigma-B regulation protein RsbU (phosphoserine phosphatase)
MNGPTHDSDRGFRSLTTRLIVWTLLAVGAVYVVTVVVSNSLGRRMALAAAEREAVNESDALASRVQDVLHAVEERTLVLARAVETLAPGDEDLGRLLRAFVPGNAEVYGAAVAFAPGTGPGRGGPHALYFHRVADRPEEIVSADLTANDYRYWEQEWYTEPVRTGRPRWSEPYRDVGGGEVAMVTWSVPFHAPDGAIRGVVTSDLRLRWLDDLVRQLELGRTGVGLIVSRSQRVIAASDRDVADRIDASEGVLEELAPEERVRYRPIVDRMLAGDSGFESVELGGRRYRLTFRPIGHAGWSMAGLYPEDELFQEVGWVRTVQAGLSVGGLGLLALVVVVLTRRLTRPLGALARSADEMATGGLDAILPPVETRDEIGRLTRAFHDMRDSLKTYIRDLKETTAAKERLEGELKVARRIQADMLPKPTAGGPDEGYELAATLIPARAVGGDLFDHFRDGRRVFFLVGDVSGKGVPAALFMARTKTLFEALATRDADPAAILAAANHNLCAENEAGMFVTAVCGMLDVTTGELTFALAGHDPPILVPAEGAPEPLQVEGGRVLGLIEGSDYPVNRLRLGHRDAIVMFTDGVSEAQNIDGGFFEIDRIVETIERHRHEDVPAVTGALLEAVRDFAGEAPQSDDITLMTLRYLAPPA